MMRNEVVAGSHCSEWTRVGQPLKFRGAFSVKPHALEVAQDRHGAARRKRHTENRVYGKSRERAGDCVRYPHETRQLLMPRLASRPVLFREIGKTP